MLEFAVAASCLVMVELVLLVPAWKFRRGQWLRLISGNLFATDDEIKRPYQRRLGRDVSNVLIFCAVGLPLLVGVSSFSEGLAARDVVSVSGVAFVLLVVLACAWVSARARRAAREENRLAGLPEPSEGERRLDRMQLVIVALIVALMLGISLSAVLLPS